MAALQFLMSLPAATCYEQALTHELPTASPGAAAAHAALCCAQHSCASHTLMCVAPKPPGSNTRALQLLRCHTTGSAMPLLPQHAWSKAMPGQRPNLTGALVQCSPCTAHAAGWQAPPRPRAAGGATAANPIPRNPWPSASPHQRRCTLLRCRNCCADLQGTAQSSSAAATAAASGLVDAHWPALLCELHCTVQRASAAAAQRPPQPAQPSRCGWACPWCS